LLAIFGLVSHLVFAAVCCAQGGALTQTVGTGASAYVIICSPAGTSRVPLADYLAGTRTGEPISQSGGSMSCAHCNLCGAAAMLSAALLLLIFAWPKLRPTAAHSLSLIAVRRAFAARGPPLSLT